MSDLGKITVTAGGAYNPSTAYEKLTIVSYQNATYMSLQSTTGHAPTETTYWMKIGDDYSSDLADTYSASATYDQGDIVLYGGVLYKANQDISVAEAWTPAHWDEKTVAELLAEVSIDMDSTPTQGSTNAVTSGGVYTALQNVSSIETTTTDPGEGATMTSDLLIVYEE